MDRRGLPASYGGTRFRSHLEARWAIFFDHLGLKWEYEPQGFAMGDTAYLPDFVIFAARGTLWAEVKPSWDSDLDGVARWRTFAAARPQPSRAALLTGQPAFIADYIVIGGDDAADNPLKGPWEDGEQRWRPCPSGYHFDLVDFWSYFAEDGCPVAEGHDGLEAIIKAAAAANSHRFGKAA